jgi:hypothetical protein
VQLVAVPTLGYVEVLIHGPSLSLRRENGKALVDAPVGALLD